MKKNKPSASAAAAPAAAALPEKRGDHSETGATTNVRSVPGVADSAGLSQAQTLRDAPAVAPPYCTTKPGLRRPSAWWSILMAACVLVLATAAAYHNSFRGPLVYDDIPSIAENPTIRQLWPLGPVLSPPSNGETVCGRPLLNFSLALNYTLGGLDVRGYHATNLAIHIAAALLLLGIVRRTLLLPIFSGRFGRIGGTDSHAIGAPRAQEGLPESTSPVAVGMVELSGSSAATWLALAAALLWAVHPVQTESVTYIVQRAESLAGLFYLLTLYSVIRAALAPSRAWRWHSWLWYATAILACLLGMATKEVMVTAPLLVLLYDRTFLAGSFAEAWRRRRGFYVGLAATWGLLAYLVVSTGLIGRQQEMGAPDVLSYLRTEPAVILHYLRLSVWPSGLCFDYAWPLSNSLAQILPGTIAMALLAALTIWGLAGRRVWGFPGAWFLLILTPTSSILPLGQAAYEHRMYLSLAAVAGLVVAAGYVLWDRLLLRFCERGHLARPAELAAGRITQPGWPRSAVRWAAPLVVLAAAVVALGYATVLRNWDYRSVRALCQDTVNKSPHNTVARYNLAVALADEDCLDEAIAQYLRIVRQEPKFALAQNNLGVALAKRSRVDEAMQHYREALRVKPNFADAHYNLGLLLGDAGKLDEAIEQFRDAVHANPAAAEAHCNLGVLLARLGKNEQAIAHYRQALLLRPAYAEVHSNLAAALAAAGKYDEAIAHCQEALRLKPELADPHNVLANVLTVLGKREEAIAQCREALRLKPELADAHNNLGFLLSGLGRNDEAMTHYQEALRLQPDFAEAHSNLAQVLLNLGRIDAAIEHYREALRLKADFPLARYGLAKALARSGKTTEAVEQYNELLPSMPDSPAVLNEFAWLLATHEAGAGGDPAQAVKLAQRLRALAGEENPQYLDTLAAAYAAAGRFSDAILTAQRALALAESAGQTQQVQRIRARLDRYRARQPYRED